MLFFEQNNKGMGELMNLDLDYNQLGGFGELSPLSAGMSYGNGNSNGSGIDLTTIKTEEELTLLNISGDKPVMTTLNGALNANTYNNIQNAMQTNPQNIDHLLKVIENQEKQNEKMLIQFRLKQVLLDYLKTKHGSNCSDPVTTCADGAATDSPSLCQQQNQCIETLETGEQRLSALLTDCKHLGYPAIGGRSPPRLTPPISPDIGSQFLLGNCTESGEQQKSSTNIPYIRLNSSQELIESQELSESIEKFYSSESEGQSNNQLTIDEEEDDFDDNNRSLFDEAFDYSPTQSSTYPNSMTSSSYSPLINASNFNTSPTSAPHTKRSTAKSDNSSNNRSRKQSTQSAPGDTCAQMQKRSAHLSAEFRYRTKLNDKITRLRNIVGPKSQLSKSGVLSRSIDLITKLQKSSSKLKEENKRLRVLLMQACNHLPPNISQSLMMQ